MPQKPVIDHRKNNLTIWYVARQVGELGLVIAVPLVGLVLLGHRLDQQFDYSAVFTLIAIPVALIISSVIIWNKIKQLQ